MSTTHEGRSLLARDDRGSIMQVGSYKTEEYEILDGTLAAATTALVADTKVVRIKSYGGNNWVKRFTPGDTEIDTLTISNTGTGFDGVYTNDGGSWSKDATYYIFLDQDLITGQPYWLLSDQVTAYIAPTNNTTNPPKTGWVGSSVSSAILGVMGAAVAPNPILAYTSYPAASIAVLDQGMLLEDGEEITMQLFQDEILSTVGGKLNIVPIAK